jgi:hypothetical protein
VTKEKPIHTDILGQPLSEGNYVAISHHNTMHICSITKLNPKMMRVMPIKHRSGDGYLIYANQSVLLSGPDALAYILTHAGK